MKLARRTFLTIVSSIPGLPLLGGIWTPTPLRLFTVSEQLGDFESRHEAIWARTPEEAKAIWWKLWGEEVELYENIKMDDLDHLESAVSQSPRKTEPYVERRYSVLREAGWRDECDTQCEMCELYGMDIVNVCQDCCVCDECGGCRCSN